MIVPTVTPIRVIWSVSLVIASLVSFFGWTIYVSGGSDPGVFYGVLGILYMPGLTFAALVGGALGVGNIHIGRSGESPALRIGILPHSEDYLQTEATARLFLRRWVVCTIGYRSTSAI
jgi:hypothetical protein